MRLLLLTTLLATAACGRSAERKAFAKDYPVALCDKLDSCGVAFEGPGDCVTYYQGLEEMALDVHECYDTSAMEHCLDNLSNGDCGVAYQSWLEDCMRTSWMAPCQYQGE